MSTGLNSEIAMTYANCNDATAVNRVAAKIQSNIDNYGELPLDIATISAATTVKETLGY